MGGGGAGRRNGSSSVSTEGWNGSSTKFQDRLGQVVENVQRRVEWVVGAGRRKRSRKAETGNQNGSFIKIKEGWKGSLGWSSEKFKGGWDVLLERVARNVQRRLDWVVQTGCRKRSRTAGTGHRKGSSEALKESRNESSEWVVGNVQEGWDGSLEQVVGNVERKIGRVVKNVQRRLGRVLRRGRRKRLMRLEWVLPTDCSKHPKKAGTHHRRGAGGYGKKCSEKDRTGRLKCSKEAWTGPQKGSSETCNEGWNGSSLRVVGNIQKRLEQIIIGRGAGRPWKLSSETFKEG